jgi:tryptophanyl-tRNA synthetase
MESIDYTEHLMKNRLRVLSGIQPSGSLTIANYIGAIRQWVRDQPDRENFFCVVDLHALTVPQDPETLIHKTREVTALYLAAGVDPAMSTVFVQSQVAAHAELNWLLTCVAPLGWLNRMTQFKDKSSKQGNQESIGAGLLNYPTLMAADILLYQADAVPVGDDQRQHLEYTRDLAQRFNHLYGEVFTIPQTLTAQAGARIMGLDNPMSKMSKSEGAEGHAIYMLDGPDVVKRKISRAVTDGGREIIFSENPEKAGVNNLLQIYMALTSKEADEVLRDFANARGYGDLKMAVTEAVNETFAPIQQRYQQMISDTHELDRILSDGREKAENVATATLALAKSRMGLLPGGQKQA